MGTGATPPEHMVTVERYERILEIERRRSEAFERQLGEALKERPTFRDLRDIENRATAKDQQIARYEHALFGVTGQGGLVGDVGELGRAFVELKDGVAQQFQGLREEEFKDLRESLDRTRASIRNWALGLLPVLIAIIGLAVILFPRV